MTANAFADKNQEQKKKIMDEHVAKRNDVELLIKVIHRLVEG